MRAFSCALMGIQIVQLIQSIFYKLTICIPIKIQENARILTNYYVCLVNFKIKSFIVKIFYSTVRL
jgi:hypothetical protein